MTDEFNLVPTNNLEKHLDNILRAASGEEPQYDLTPNWRTEQYLAAIAAKLSGGGSGGGVLVVHDVDGTLDKTWQEIKDAMLVGSVVIDRSSQLATDIVYVGRVFFTSFGGDIYSVYTDGDANQYDTSSASGYPTHS